jgi:predicted RNA-binding protein with PIN domain
MAREYLIDAYNVIFAHPKLGPLARQDVARARDEFLALVSQIRPADASRVVVVFDAHRDPAPATETGVRNRAHARGLLVVYAPESADTWIREHVRSHAHPQQLTVVTSDREILATAKAYGAAMQRAREFLRIPVKRQPRPAPGTEPAPHLSKRELAEWERLFERKADDDESP